jgi:hypothetical protein
MIESRSVVEQLTASVGTRHVVRVSHFHFADVFMGKPPVGPIKGSRAVAYRR